MIKNVRAWQEWENGYVRSEPPDLQRNFRIFDALYEEARALARFARPDPLDGLAMKIRVARIINARADSGGDGSGI